jgi:glutaredoxin
MKLTDILREALSHPGGQYVVEFTTVEDGPDYMDSYAFNVAKGEFEQTNLGEEEFWKESLQSHINNTVDKIIKVDIVSGDRNEKLIPVYNPSLQTELKMKLTNILREINEEEEDGMKQMKVNYDLAVQPADLDAALAALNDTANYGIYAQNMRDPKAIVKAFGPSIPAQKAGAAWKDWDSRSEDEKAFKIIDIKNRVPEAWAATEKEAESGYEKWQAEGNDGSLNDYLFTLSGKSLPKSLVGTYGKNYYPMKTPDNLKKYAGKLEQDIHYVVKDGKIIFPSTLENPYKTKPYLSKVLKTIMDNAGVEFKLIDVEQDSEAPKTIEKSKGEAVPPLSTTVNSADQADKLRKLLQAKLGDVPNAKYEVETTGEGTERKYKLVVTGITASQRAALQPLTIDFKLKLKESIDFERRQMLVRAGIIK